MSLSLKVRVLNFFRGVFKIPFLESMLANTTTDRSPDHLVCKLVPNPYQYKTNSYRIVRRNGLILRVDISDYIGHYLYFGFYDYAIEKLFSLCHPGSNVIDIGTNIGWVALNFAKITQHGSVIGFEPDPFNFQVCQNNIKLNNFSNLIVLPIGLGETSDTVKMEVRTPDNRGGNRIATQVEKGSVTVTIKSLDSVPEIQSLIKIDLIKLDVEGYELKVLKGAKNLLLKHTPTLFIEIDDNNLRDQGDSAVELILFLKSCGYKTIQHAETNSQLSHESDFSNCHFDIVAS